MVADIDRLPKCKHRKEGNINEGLICDLSKHECYWKDSIYIDCWCLVASGLCPKKLKLKEVIENGDS